MPYSSFTSSYINPYESFFPIESPEKLYGRHEILRHIFRRLFRTDLPQSLQLIGLARFGKSSVLNVLKCLNDYDCSDYFNEEFGLEPDFLKSILVVKVDCAGLSIEESSKFWNLMDQQLTLAQLPTTEQLKTQRVGPITFEDFARKLFTIKKSRFIFLLDGFERVLRHGHIDISHNLRYLLEKGMGSIAYITATPQTYYHYYTERSDAKNMATLFSYFDPEPIYLGLLAKEGAKQFIKEPSTKNDVTFTKEDIDFVFHIGGQHPDLTRMLCKFLFDNYQLPFIQRADYRELYTQLKNYFGLFYNIIKKEDLVSAQFNTLVHVAMHSNLHDLPDKDQSELIKLGLLIRNPDDNHIHIFSEVLKDFLAEENPVGTSINKAPQLIGGQFDKKTQPSSASLHLKVWEKQRAVQVGDKLVHLTPNEWKLFIYLWQHANQTCTRDELIAALSSNDVGFTAAALDITISRLRKKIPRFIITVHGQGYLFKGNNTVTVVGS